VVVREDLPKSYQAVQAAHAGIQFQHEHPEIAREWHDKSKYLVHLSARDINHLEDLIYKANRRDIKISVFREPDIGNEITAVAFEPSDASRRLLSNLPLNLKERSEPCIG
jgi:peptidyl-tRNA hydrolase